MINYFLKYHARKIKNNPPVRGDILNSKKILFPIFTRYGDTIINVVIIREFIGFFPDKEYLILCPKQMKPYVTELLPNVDCISINKRNLFDMLRIDNILKNRQFDIGFNPWSNGLDSCYFLTYCKKYLCYKDFEKPKNINHYQIVRKYLKLPEKTWFINNLLMKDSYRKILICPQSTDKYRNIPADQLDKLIQDLQKKYHKTDITIASMDQSYFREKCNKFIFNKTAESSELFISLVKESELILCADSAPLHLALALKKDLKAFFRSTIPSIVVNSGSYLNINNQYFLNE
jgi:ADP-heptose:LPS heptosyltransferase